ncbi:unnamed protein product [Chrysoparadoxa australica]
MLWDQVLAACCLLLLAAGGNARPAEPITLAFTGDCMVSKLIDQLLPHPSTDWYLGQGQIERDRIDYYNQSDDYLYKRPWGTMLDHMRDSDLCLINLESAVTASDNEWTGKTWHFKMHPDNIDVLTAAGVDFANNANNHVLDYRYEGMESTLQALDEAGIAHAGVGINIEAAMKPAILETRGMKVAVYSFGDHGCWYPNENSTSEEEDNGRVYDGCFADKDGFDGWAATESRAGISYIDFYKPELLERAVNKVREGKTKEGADLVLVSLHCGPNWQFEVSARQQSFVKRLIDEAAADLIWGSSSHHMQGVEVYQGKPIIYGSGNFVDDYHVELPFRNDLGMMYKLEVDPVDYTLRRLVCIPTKIHDLSANQLAPIHKDFLW